MHVAETIVQEGAIRVVGDTMGVSTFYAVVEKLASRQACLEAEMLLGGRRRF
jgi:hypothetical protein